MKKIAIHKLFAFIIISLSILLSAGCAKHYSTPTNHTNTKWIVEDINGKGIIDFSHLWLRLDDDGKIYGSGGCNSFRGHYSIHNGMFQTGPLATTRMACPKALNIQEFKFLQTLEKARKISTQNGLLYLEGDAGTLRFSSGR